MSHLKGRIAEARKRGDRETVARLERIEMAEKHPGFGSVQGRIASRLRSKEPGLSREEAHARAGAILANASRHASPGAKRANPKLRRVR